MLEEFELNSFEVFPCACDHVCLLRVESIRKSIAFVVKHLQWSRESAAIIACRRMESIEIRRKSAAISKWIAMRLLRIRTKSRRVWNIAKL